LQPFKRNKKGGLCQNKYISTFSGLIFCIFNPLLQILKIDLYCVGRVHIENSIKPNEVHPGQGPEILEQDVATLGQFGRKLPKLLSQPIVVGALRSAPVAPAAPIVVPTIAQPPFESQRTIPLELQPQVQREALPISVQPQRPPTVYVVPRRNMQHYLQYEHSYFHGK
jgi:hypothetical protein